MNEEKGIGRVMDEQVVFSKSTSGGEDAFFCCPYFYKEESEVSLTRELFSIGDMRNLATLSATDVRIKVQADINHADDSMPIDNKVMMSLAEIEAIRNLVFAFQHINESDDSGIKGCIEMYFEVLVQIFESANQALKSSSYLFFGYKRILEELLLMNSYRLKNESGYVITDTHPIVLMNKCLKKASCQLVPKGASPIEKRLLSTIFETQNRNRRYFKIYATNKVMEVGDNIESCSKYYKAEKFGNVKNHTEIPAIRLLEKVQSYKKNHKEHQGEIRIACFGKLDDWEILKEVCRLDDISNNKTGEHYIINPVFFTRKVAIGKYYFVNEEESSRKEVYDLLNALDVESLFEKYQIVLFMDMNYFYRQHQHVKNMDEKNEVENCKWYLDRAKMLGEFKDKAIIYQLIYNHVGMWLNSYDTEMSAAYEFDEKLYMSLSTAYKPKTDVYLYIKYGNAIAGRSLRYSNACNDEYYDGTELIVYKFGQDIDINQLCHEFTEQKCNFNTRINFWKILKSMNNSFCRDILKELAQSDSEVDVAKVIKSCKDTFIILNYSNIKTNQEQEISYFVQAKDLLIKQKAEEITGVVLRHALGLENIVCVRRYFRQLITNSIISNAEDVSDLLFAHLLAKGKLDGRNCVKSENEQQVSKGKESTIFRVKRTFYSVIEKLADLRIRSIEDRTGYFVYTVRKEICPEIEENTFREMLTKVAKCCENFNYTDSMLYMNSKLQ